ncbi:hypothetical protein AN277_0203495 [Rothia kristinae]|uniref:Uncharacterized protein n=1 Tax=Rothia kristinae TaxID=37923 RepID=A0A199NUP3_9MICC|nr:hypothetical protein AN277_0203495 [Rothia kristinae]
MRGPSRRKKNSITTIRRDPASSSVTTETPSTALEPASLVRRYSPALSRYSFRCVSSRGTPQPVRISASRLAPCCAWAERSGHSSITVITIPEMMPASTSRIASSAVTAAPTREKRARVRRARMMGFIAAAMIRAISSGRVTSFSVAASHTPRPTTPAISRVCRHRIAARP